MLYTDTTHIMDMVMVPFGWTICIVMDLRVNSLTVVMLMILESPLVDILRWLVSSVHVSIT